MKTRTLLTVDWDAFIPEPLEADMGHKENMLFREMMWQTGTRGWLKDVMKPSDFARSSFWSNVATEKAQARYLSDSHMVGFDICRKHQINKVIIVDQHHDLWPFNYEGFEVDCANWLRAAVEVLGVHEIVWYAPAFSHCVPEEGTPEADKLFDWLDEHGASLTVKTMEDFIEDGTHHPTVLHACRSSCWTPPWLDANFRRFVAKLQPATILDPAAEQGMGEWNPLDQRGNVPDDDEIWGDFFEVNPNHKAGRLKLRDHCIDWVRSCGEHVSTFGEPLPPEGEEN